MRITVGKIVQFRSHELVEPFLSSATLQPRETACKVKVILDPTSSFNGACLDDTSQRVGSSSQQSGQVAQSHRAGNGSMQWRLGSGLTAQSSVQNT